MCDKDTQPAKPKKAKKHLKGCIKQLQHEVDFLAESEGQLRKENRQYRQGILIASRAVFVGAALLTARWVLGGRRY